MPSRLLVSVLSVVAVCTSSLGDDRPVPVSPTLPRTTLLELSEPLDVVMVRGINLHAERELQKARDARSANWLQHATDSDEGQKARQSARDSLKKTIGLPSQLEAHPQLARTSELSPGMCLSGRGIELGNSIITSCQWDAITGVTGRGLIAIPTEQESSAKTPLTLVVIIPDVDQTPEACFGLEQGIPESQQLARQFAERGCIVLCPVIIDRDHAASGDSKVAWTDLPHREFVYRLAFELGLHPVGFDVAKVLTGIQAMRNEFTGRSISCCVIGTGEGGFIALAAGAVDDEQIDAVTVRGYFNEREQVWQEPIYRNLFGQLQQFGDAELASLIAPRPLIIENCPVTSISEVITPAGRRKCAAPGKVGPISAESLQREFEKAQNYYGEAGAGAAIRLLSTESDSEKTLIELLDAFGLLAPAISEPTGTNATVTPALPHSNVNHSERMIKQVNELVRYTQRVLHQSHHVRDALWKDLKQNDVASFVESAEPFRKLVHESFIGKLPEASLPLNPRSRKIIDEPTYSGFEVVLDIHPPGPPGISPAEDWGVIAGGILLVPKDLRPDERRPVVVFQHGLEGVPMDTITTDPAQSVSQIYHAVSVHLVQRGFVVYAPQNPYRGRDNFRVIQRKCHPIGRSLFSYIVEQHRQTLNWLAAQSYVDANRIGFYGLSYGGKTAMRVPQLLIPRSDQAGYCLTICSADFNDWIRKNASGDERYSYVFTGEYEIFEWNMAHIANYAELSKLMLPRPFMVERGLDDGVAPDEWVAAEYAKVRRPYVKLGLADHTELEIFDGPHAINGHGTYEFLHRHLKWPKPTNQ